MYDYDEYIYYVPTNPVACKHARNCSPNQHFLYVICYAYSFELLMVHAMLLPFVAIINIFIAGEITPEHIYFMYDNCVVKCS